MIQMELRGIPAPDPAEPDPKETRIIQAHVPLAVYLVFLELRKAWHQNAKATIIRAIMDAWAQHNLSGAQLRALGLEDEPPPARPRPPRPAALPPKQVLGMVREARRNLAARGQPPQPPPPDSPPPAAPPVPPPAPAPSPVLAPELIRLARVFGAARGAGVASGKVPRSHPDDKLDCVPKMDDRAACTAHLRGAAGEQWERFTNRTIESFERAFVGAFIAAHQATRHPTGTPSPAPELPTEHEKKTASKGKAKIEKAGTKKKGAAKAAVRIAKPGDKISTRPRAKSSSSPAKPPSKAPLFAVNDRVVIRMGIHTGARGRVSKPMQNSFGRRSYFVTLDLDGQRPGAKRGLLLPELHLEREPPRDLVLQTPGTAKFSRSPAEAYEEAKTLGEVDAGKHVAPTVARLTEVRKYIHGRWKDLVSEPLDMGKIGEAYGEGYSPAPPEPEKTA
jgi:hypothetical protein